MRLSGENWQVPGVVGRSQPKLQGKSWHMSGGVGRREVILAGDFF